MNEQVDISRLEFAAQEQRGPVVLRRPSSDVAAHKWLSENRALVDQILGTVGGVVLRDLGFASVSEFNQAVQIFRKDLLDYVHRSTPRSKVGGKLYSATEYPADRIIALHNENSYTDSWPSLIFFYCLVAAERGGETPVADSREVYRRIDPAIREKFEREGVLYVRNYNEGVDLSWQEVFQTDNRSDVEEYCSTHNIQFEWHDRGPALTTRQRCQATMLHPRTNQHVWFNQAHLFHISALDNAEQRTLIDEFGIDNIPRNAFYGDGSPIEEGVIEHIREAYEQEKVQFSWQRGEIMILDNLLFAHGRSSFEGARRVIVAMA